MQNKLKLIIMSILIFTIGMLVLYWKLDLENILPDGGKSENYFVVIPHHSITSKNIDSFYQNISQKYKNIKNVVIISPNHFWNGTSFLESFREDWAYCFGNQWIEPKEKNCINWWKLDFYQYEKSNLYDLADYETDKDYFLVWEHGIWEHFKFINKYFPNYKKVYPVVLRIETNNDFKETKEVLEKIKDYDFWKWNTLFISSVDFSHHVFEKVAIFHDMKTIEELNKKDFEIAEVDCPNCLFLNKSLASYNQKNIFKLQNRTSSSDIVWKNILYENTSHIFWEFISWNNKEKTQIKSENIAFLDNTNGYEKINTGSWEISSWVYWMFFWDSHLTRGFTYKETQENNIPASYKDKKKYLECFYQNKDTNNDIRYWKNRLFYSFDYVWINLETAVCEEKDTVESEKTVRFLTKPNNLDYFKEVWINLFDVANNHSYDYWNKCFSKMKEILENKNLNYFGEWRGSESNILKVEKNGFKLAFIWINDTTYSWKLEDKIAIIKQLKLEWYKVILNIHWWLEYKETNTPHQQDLAYKFIDAGVDMIVWHHPHVVWNYEVYKWVPIFYSLWNFIFDQYLEETLDWMGIVYRIDGDSLRYSIINFSRSAEDFSVDCDSWR